MALWPSTATSGRIQEKCANKHSFQDVNPKNTKIGGDTELDNFDAIFGFKSGKA